MLDPLLLSPGQFHQREEKDPKKVKEGGGKGSESRGLHVSIASASKLSRSNVTVLEPESGPPTEQPAQPAEGRKQKRKGEDWEKSRSTWPVYLSSSSLRPRRSWIGRTESTFQLAVSPKRPSAARTKFRICSCSPHCPGLRHLLVSTAPVIKNADDEPDQSSQETAEEAEAKGLALKTQGNEALMAGHYPEAGREFLCLKRRPDHGPDTLARYVNPRAIIRRTTHADALLGSWTLCPDADALPRRPLNFPAPSTIQRYGKPHHRQHALLASGLG
ncbi:hypothetical protein THAOC_17745, partial [Thalassiosira oceanica]